MQNMNQRTPHQVRSRRRRRTDEVQLLCFVNEVAEWQLDRGRTVILENPVRSLAWDQNQLKALASHPKVGTSIIDMCMYNKRRPDNGKLIKKTTKLMGNKSIMEKICTRCDGSNDHDGILGSMKYTDVYGKMKAISASTWAGAYTPELSNGMLDAGADVMQQREQKLKRWNSSFPTEA